MTDGETPDDADPSDDPLGDDLLPPEGAPSDVDDEGDVEAPAGDAPGPDSDADPDADPERNADADETAPMEGLAAAARDRGPTDDDDLMDAFEEVDVGDVDGDALWEQLEDDGIEETVDEPRGRSEQDVRVVNKREYCMRCQYLSAPPEVRCGHEHGEIREVVDSERFEVADCPILRGEEELENLRR